MKLAELRIACYLYGKFTKDDQAYERFLSKTHPTLNLDNQGHSLAVIEWLQDWGCRQFATAYIPNAVQSLMTWYQKHRDNPLFNIEAVDLWEVGQEGSRECGYVV